MNSVVLLWVFSFWCSCLDYPLILLYVLQSLSADLFKNFEKLGTLTFLSLFRFISSSLLFHSSFFVVFVRRSTSNYFWCSSACLFPRRVTLFTLRVLLDICVFSVSLSSWKLQLKRCLLSSRLPCFFFVENKSKLVWLLACMHSSTAAMQPANYLPWMPELGRRTTVSQTSRQVLLFVNILVLFRGKFVVNNEGYWTFNSSILTHEMTLILQFETIFFIRRSLSISFGFLIEPLQFKSKLGSRKQYMYVLETSQECIFRSYSCH